MKFDTKKQLEALERHIKKSYLPCVLYAPIGAGKSHVLSVISEKHDVEVNETYAYGKSVNYVIKSCIEAADYDAKIVVSVCDIEIFKKIKQMKVVNCFGFNRDYHAVESFLSERIGG